jgi:class 3 adenylate cyclase
MTKLLDFEGDQNLRQTLDNLTQVNGFCIMVDIVGSTELKDRDEKEWIILFGNTFSHARGGVGLKFLKTVGDELMFWFKDEDLGQTPLELIQKLDDMLREKKAEPNLYPPVRVAVCRCSGVLEISFMRPGDDVFGKEIDLTARLLALAAEGEVVMNEEFRNIVRQQFERCGGQGGQFVCVERIQGPWSQKIKGFSKPQTIYKLPP